MKQVALRRALRIGRWIGGVGTGAIAPALLWTTAGGLTEQQLQTNYNQAVEDAARVELGENINSLTAITADTPHLIWNEDHSKILVVTWKNWFSYEQFIQPNTHTAASENYLTWVTVAPEIQEFCQQYLAQNPDATVEELDLRLKQHLGLHYDWNYDVFVQLWVAPEDLFRPCVDPEINDTQCNIGFDENPAQINNIAHYQSFYTNLYFQSFRHIPGVPWTGLGYTFDWGNPVTDVGISEFILTPNAPYTIESVQPTLDYCQAAQTP
ncbi:MAG: hypothetical protein VKJ64_07545 [Leptolyngbyaceae bacterium]|nr:hypothetical protein [Leptolyngbyaceae bacterium]